MNARPEQPVHDFKALFERCLSEAGLSTRTLRLGILADTKLDLPENSIESWRRPHTTTGQPSLPREDTAALLARWLCVRPGVTATAEELLAAWRSDRVARAATRTVRVGPTRATTASGSCSTRASPSPPTSCT